MDRSIDHDAFNVKTRRGKAELARLHAIDGIDEYSDYGVGSVVTIDTGLGSEESWHTYGGFNINLPGMQVKMHAEQMALYQALMDIEIKDGGVSEESPVDLVDVMVVTTEDDLSLVCGHCLQVARSFCNAVGTDPDDVIYSAAALTDDNEFEYDRHPLSDLIGDTYVDNRVE